MSLKAFFVILICHNVHTTDLRDLIFTAVAVWVQMNNFEK